MVGGGKAALAIPGVLFRTALAGLTAGGRPFSGFVA